eukprot:XP_766726.1 hypothetical protein [Theileria parva strain Muguga]
MEDSTPTTNINTINTVNSINSINSVNGVNKLGMRGITTEHALVAKEIVYNSLLSGQLSPNPSGVGSPVRFNSLSSVNSFKADKPTSNITTLVENAVGSCGVVLRSNHASPKNSNPTTNTSTNTDSQSVNTECDSIRSESLNGMVVTGSPNVWLNIYDLENVHRVVNVIADVVGAGAYHAGVEVYGNEYNYGYNPKGGTGITSSFPKYHPYHTYIKSVDLGKTKYTPQQVSDIINHMKPHWNALDYNILHNSLWQSPASLLSGPVVA